jgi:hypothetical protein
MVSVGAVGHIIWRTILTANKAHETIEASLKKEVVQNNGKLL